jgi:hypothetical protein
LLPPLFAGRRPLFPQSLVHCVNRLLEVVLQLFARRSAVWSLRQSQIKPRVNKTPTSEAGTEGMSGKQQATNARRHAWRTRSRSLSLVCVPVLRQFCSPPSYAPPHSSPPRPPESWQAACSGIAGQLCHPGAKPTPAVHRANIARSGNGGR